MSKQFDELAKDLAKGLSRRSAIGRFLAGIGATAAGILFTRGKARAETQAQYCLSYCSANYDGEQFAQCLAYSAECTTPGDCAVLVGGSGGVNGVNGGGGYINGVNGGGGSVNGVNGGGGYVNGVNGGGGSVNGVNGGGGSVNGVNGGGGGPGSWVCAPVAGDTLPPTVPANGNSCNGVYGGTFDGNLTVSAGQSCIFLSGGVTGNIKQNGGNLVLIQSKVGGNVQIQDGTFTIGPGTAIGGNLQIQNIPAGPAQNQICGTSVHGDLQFQNNGTEVLIGAGSPSPCVGNTVGGNLQVQNNTAPTTMIGNIVGGNLQDQNNTAPTQVFNNVIGGNLQCQNDAVITGGGNTARQKQGQCAAF